METDKNFENTAYDSPNRNDSEFQLSPMEIIETRIKERDFVGLSEGICLINDFYLARGN